MAGTPRRGRGPGSIATSDNSTPSPIGPLSHFDSKLPNKIRELLSFEAECDDRVLKGRVRPLTVMIGQSWISDGEGRLLMVKPDHLLIAVQEVLFREWDPIGVNDNELCRDEYNSYAPTICRWLRDGVDEQKFASHLSQLQSVSMGMSKLDDGLHRRIARRLLELVR